MNGLLRMARGQQKLQSQAKAAERAAKVKKQMGHSSSDQKKAAQKALVYVCAVCKVIKVTISPITCIRLSIVNVFVVFQAQMPDPKTYKQHFENKHPKNEVPAELKDV